MTELKELNLHQSSPPCVSIDRENQQLVWRYYFDNDDPHVHSIHNIYF